MATASDSISRRAPGRPPRRSHRWLIASAVVALAACSGGSVDTPGGSTGGGGGGGSGGGGQAGGYGRALTLTPRFDVANAHANARTDTVLASVPFPEGMITGLGNVGVAGRATAWTLLQTWPDGSVRVAQAQFTDDFTANETKHYEVVRDVSPLTGAFQPNDWVAQPGREVTLRVVVRDTNNKAYVAETSALGGDVLRETPLLRVTRKRVYHQPAEQGCIGRDYLTSTFYVQEFRDMPFVTVDWVLGNDYLGRDDPAGSTDPNMYPLGGVDVNEASLAFRGADEVRGYRPDWHAIDAPVVERDWTRFVTMHDTYVDDGQTRRYRFLLRYQHPNASTPDAQRWRDAFAARVEEPLFAICDIDTWQLTIALGLHGGPIDAPSDAEGRAAQDFGRWLGAADNFGTWGAFGDVKRSNTSGTPRNTPLSWEAAHAIQARSREMMLMLEGKAWAQGMRPNHLFGLTVGAEEDLCLWYPMALTPGTPDITPESLGRRALWANDPYPQLRTRVDYRGNGWNGYDNNHWTTDALFDYWTLSGDDWAREELREIGQCLKSAMRLKNFATAEIRNARAEGWCMVGFVQSYLATRDEALKTYILRRIDEIVEPQRWKQHPGRPMREYGPDPRYGVGENTTAFPPWEHAAVMFGFLGAYKHLGSEVALRIAEDVVTTLDYSWVSNYTHPATGQYYEHGVRYATPLRDNGVDVPADFRDRDPNFGANIAGQGLNSVNQFFVSALSILPYYSTDQQVLNRAQFRREILFPEATDAYRWNKWFLVCPQHYTALKNLGQGGGN